MATHGNLGWNTMVSQRATSGMDEIVVSVKPYGEADIAVAPRFIKIDVEGAEHRVLAGMRRELSDFSPKPVILCEIGWGTAHPEWEQELRELRHLLGLGYAARDLDGAPVAIEAIARTTDVLFVPVQQPVEPTL